MQGYNREAGYMGKIIELPIQTTGNLDTCGCDNKERITEKMALCLAYDYLQRQSETTDGSVYALFPDSDEKITLVDSLNAIKNCIAYV